MGATVSSQRILACLKLTNTSQPSTLSCPRSSCNIYVPGGARSLPTSGLGSSRMGKDGIFFKKSGPSLGLLLKYWKGDALSSGVMGCGVSLQCSHRASSLARVEWPLPEAGPLLKSQLSFLPPAAFFSASYSTRTNYRGPLFKHLDNFQDSDGKALI